MLDVRIANGTSYGLVGVRRHNPKINIFLVQFSIQIEWQPVRQHPNTLSLLLINPQVIGKNQSLRTPRQNPHIIPLVRLPRIPTPYRVPRHQIKKHNPVPVHPRGRRMSELPPALPHNLERVLDIIPSSLVAYDRRLDIKLAETGHGVKVEDPVLHLAVVRT